MKLFFNYLKDFIREDYNIKYYTAIAILVGVAITINFSIDLEDGIIDPIRPYPLRVGAFFILYGGLYLMALGVSWYFNRDSFSLKSKGFLINLLVGLLILSCDIAFQPYGLLNKVPAEIRIFTGKILSNIISILSTFLPLLLFYVLYDKSQSSFYGLTRKGFIVKPYLKLFSIVIPLAFAGSFLPGFQQQYPMYLSTGAHVYWQVPEIATIGSYELAYAWNFLTIELLFRGFFVIGMIKFLGRHAIIPMAVIYCSIHFGKPMGECISSVFGGYFLGIVAYYSRNIWGGVVIHVGLAWLMEIAAAGQKALF